MIKIYCAIFGHKYPLDYREWFCQGVYKQVYCKRCGFIGTLIEEDSGGNS